MLACPLLLFAASALASYLVNVNCSSFNGLYRDRLVRAFLGSSNTKAILDRKIERNPFDDLRPPTTSTWTTFVRIRVVRAALSSRS